MPFAILPTKNHIKTSCLGTRCEDLITQGDQARYLSEILARPLISTQVFFFFNLIFFSQVLTQTRARVRVRVRVRVHTQARERARAPTWSLG